MSKCEYSCYRKTKNDCIFYNLIILYLNETSIPFDTLSLKSTPILYNGNTPVQTGKRCRKIRKSGHTIHKFTADITKLYRLIPC